MTPNPPIERTPNTQLRCRDERQGLTIAGLKEGKEVPGERLPALTPVPDDTEFVRNPDTCL